VSNGIEIANAFKWIWPRGDRGPVRPIRLAALRIGIIAHVRSYEFFGRGIRYCHNRWQQRVCREKGVAHLECWGNHDAIVTRAPATGEWGFGEAMYPVGKFTPLWVYQEDIRKRKCEVRFFEVMDANEADEAEASLNWWALCEGKQYDKTAFLRLAYKSLVADWSYSSKAWKRKIGDAAAGYRQDFWCTESVRDVYLADPPGIDPYWGENNPTPMHTEIRAGRLEEPRHKPITLREISGQLLVDPVWIARAEVAAIPA